MPGHCPPPPPEIVLASLEKVRTLSFSIETKLVPLLSEDFVLLVHKSLALGHTSEMLF